MTGLRATGRDVRDAALGLVPTALALLIAAALLEGLRIDNLWVAVLAALVTAVVDAVVRPLLRVVAGLLGAVGALLAGLAVQLLVIRVVLGLVPGVSLAGGIETLLATLLVVAVVAAAGRWLIGVNDSSYLVSDLIRRGRARRRRSGAAPVPAGTGLVVVQVDGMPRPLLEFGITSGVLPTLSRWVRSGSHEASGWWARVPSTTPVSQAGLLHGTTTGIPAFRWYEKDSGRLMVTNRPADAAVVEARISDGSGLLAQGGVSISNVFSGDAPTTYLVMSRAGARGGLGPGGAYLRFFAGPYVFARALVLTVGEMLKELYQGRQQRIRGIEPRVHRRGAYVGLRGVTNAALRDLNVALVAESMMAGAPVVFVDFLDYDEIAHHAGVARRESLDALAGVDRVLGTLERVADAAPRPYRFVVLSDHGQSQGATFRQVSGMTLEEAVRRHAGAQPADTVAATGDVEAAGPLNAILAEVLGSTRRTDRWVRRREPEMPSDTPEVVVVGSGNLGGVWFPRLPGRVPLEGLAEYYPALVTGLVAEPGIGFLVVDSARGPLAIGPAGVHALRDGAVEGEDPLLPFGPRAAADLLHAAEGPLAPDVYVHSALDPRTGEVHAFEELVGCHGGLGGWQNLASLVHPSDWPLDDDLLDRSVPGEAVLYGAESVHRQLVRWLERCGARTP